MAREAPLNASATLAGLLPCRVETERRPSQGIAWTGMCEASPPKLTDDDDNDDVEKEVPPLPEGGRAKIELR